MVEEAWKIDGVIGSRMTGAGFGGCTVSIVKDEAVDTFTKKSVQLMRRRSDMQQISMLLRLDDGPVKLA